MPIDPDDLVDEVMRSHPTTIRVFLDFKMSCVGCPIACFHTVNDACVEHGVSLSVFLQAARDAVKEDRSKGQ
jgi:hybrid cluster-associated redox disulfide protein